MTTIHFEPRTDALTDDAQDVAALIAGVARSDERAWAGLTKRYQPMVAGIARQFRLSEADVADVTQTVWLRLLEHVGRLRQPERVGGWLAATARNESLRVARQGQRTAPVDDSTFSWMADEDAADLPPVEVAERAAIVRAAVATLPGQQRDLVELLMADDRPSYVEVASSLGIAMGSIGPTRQRGLRALRAKCVAAHLTAA